jgi:hypothetical protein
MNSIKDWLIDERQRMYGRIRDIWLRDCCYAQPESTALRFSVSDLEYMSQCIKHDNTNAHFCIGYLYGIINTLSQIK